jgi:thiol-disulfide isomerase/thioredoxin
MAIENCFPKLAIKQLIVFLQIFLLFTALVFAFGLRNSAYSQNVTISGRDSSYANDELIFYTFTDYISKNEKELGRCKTQNDGRFLCTFAIKETIQAHIYLNIFKGLIYLEPGKNYHIILPPKTLKTPKEEYDPFFKEYEIYFGIADSNENELNTQIKKFDKQYDLVLKKVFYNIGGLGVKTKIDSIAKTINKNFPDINNKYFNTYKYYKLAYLKYIGFKRNTTLATRLYFLNKPALYYNPAYMDFFNQVFDNFFSIYSHTKDGENIISDVILSKSVTKLKKTLGKNISLSNDTLKELVILKGLYDAFYSGKEGELVSFPKAQLLQTLDSVKLLSKIPVHREIAENIKKKTTNLMAGTDAPVFRLYDLNDQQRYTNEFTGKYVYLQFAASWSYTCMNEFDILNKFYSKYKNKIEVITIFADNDTSVINPFLRTHDYSWTFFYCRNNSDVIKRYNVKTYPTYYLINPDGKLVQSPAQSITEHFEAEFNKILDNN